MTRKEKHSIMLDLCEDYFDALYGAGDYPSVNGVTLTVDDVIAGIRFVRGRADEAPGWWAEYVFEERSRHREDQEET